MILGGHINSLADIEFLQNLGLGFGEIIFRDERTRQLWRDSGVFNPIDSGFFLLAHGPQEGPPNDLENLWHRYLPALKSTVDVVNHMGIPLLTIHLWVDSRFIKPRVIEEKKKILSDIVNYGCNRGIIICLENLSENVTDLAAVLNAVPNLRITLDIGHGQLNSEINTSFGIIAQLSDCITHVHVHDNRGGTGVGDDLHLQLGEGIIEFPRILRALIDKGYDRTMTIELNKEQLSTSIIRLKGILKDLLESDP